IGGVPDPLQRREHAVQQEDDDRQHHDQQDHVAYPPQDHDWLLARSICFCSLPGRSKALPSLVAPPSLLSPGNAAARQLAGWYGRKNLRKTRLSAICAARRARVKPLAGVPEAAAIWSADSPRSIRSIRSCMFAEKSRISTAVTSVIMPRPYCAAAPDSCRSWL